MSVQPGSSPASRVAAVLLAVGMALLLAGAGAVTLKYRVYAVLSDSMAATLLPGDRIISDTGYSGGQDVRRGDVVMLDRLAWPHAPERAELVKRVVAVGGDTVGYSAQDGNLVVNSLPVEEDYLSEGTVGGYEDFTAVVPPQHIFVLGDNRAGSIDSRAHLGTDVAGAVPRSAVRGRVVAVVYPVGRVGAVPPSSAFGAPHKLPIALSLVAFALAGGVVLVLTAGAIHVAVRIGR